MTTRKIFVYGFLAVILALAFTACSGSGGGGKSINSATELKEYMDKQPANSPDKPIKVAMKVNEMMIKDIVEVLNNAGKYVSLDLSGSPLTEIPVRAFSFCKTLVGIIIPNSVTSIGVGAFAGTGLTSVTIPNSVTSIGVGAFGACTTTSITIPNSVTHLSGFNNNQLTSVTIPNSVTTIGNGAFQDNQLTSVTIPNSVTTIGWNAFMNNQLTSVTIPNSVTTIGDYAFAFNQLTSVTIGNSVTEIGSNAFFCENLTSVTFQGTIASDNFSSEAFYGDLKRKYLTGGIGTYTTNAPVHRWNSIWTKQ